MAKEKDYYDRLDKENLELHEKLSFKLMRSRH